MLIENRELFSVSAPYRFKKPDLIVSKNSTTGELSTQFSKERAAQVGAGIVLVSIGTIMIFYGAKEIGDRHPVTGVILTAVGLFFAKKGLDLIKGQGESTSKRETDQRLVSYQAA